MRRGEGGREQSSGPALERQTRLPLYATLTGLFAVRSDTDHRAYPLQSSAEVRAYGMLDENGRPVIDPARNMKTPEQGPATSVRCATRRQLEGLAGVYCEDCDIAVPVPGDFPPSSVVSGLGPWIGNLQTSYGI